MTFVFFVIDIAGAVNQPHEVKDNILSHFQIEGDDCFPLNRFTERGGYVERQVVDDLANVRFPVFCQFFGDSLAQHLSLDVLYVQNYD